MSPWGLGCHLVEVAYLHYNMMPSARNLVGSQGDVTVGNLIFDPSNELPRLFIFRILQKGLSANSPSRIKLFVGDCLRPRIIQELALISPWGSFTSFSSLYGSPCRVNLARQTYMRFMTRLSWAASRSKLSWIYMTLVTFTALHDIQVIVFPSSYHRVLPILFFPATTVHSCLHESVAIPSPP